MKPTLQIDWRASPAGLPLFQRIAEGIAREIRRGRLRPSEKLPSSRALAESLEVHRNTILAAFDELQAQGYLETRPARGTFVASELPDLPSRSHRASPSKPVVPRLAPLRPATRFEGLSRGTIALLGGLPDLRNVPSAAYARALRAALKTLPTCLDYQAVRGQPRFVETFSKHLADMRGVVAGEGEMLVTRGSQQALFLAAKAVCRPGSVIAVERAGYPPAWEGFRLAGARLMPIRTDKDGLVVSDLEELSEREDVAAVYVCLLYTSPSPRDRG